MKNSIKILIITALSLFFIIVAWFIKGKLTERKAEKYAKEFFNDVREFATEMYKANELAYDIYGAYDPINSYEIDRNNRKQPSYLRESIPYRFRMRYESEFIEAWVYALGVREVKKKFEERGSIDSLQIQLEKTTDILLNKVMKNRFSKYAKKRIEQSLNDILEQCFEMWGYLMAVDVEIKNPKNTYEENKKQHDILSIQMRKGREMAILLRDYDYESLFAD